MKVKDTYLSEVKKGDIGLHMTKGILAGDFLGVAIVIGEGNKVPDRDGDGKMDEGYSSGNYTHTFLVSEPPDPEARVEAVRVDKKSGYVIYRVIDQKLAGKKIHSTWPRVKEEPIKWEETHMEIWRIREVSRLFHKNGVLPEEVGRMIEWARSQKGQPYDWLHLITFGLIALHGRNKCSRFVFEAALQASQFGKHRDQFLLSPEGRHDGLVSPNDLVNSGKLIRLRYQGMKA